MECQLPGWSWLDSIPRLWRNHPKAGETTPCEKLDEISHYVQALLAGCSGRKRLIFEALEPGLASSSRQRFSIPVLILTRSVCTLPFWGVAENDWIGGELEWNRGVDAPGVYPGYRAPPT
jgi:hypothetical protein